MPSFITNVFAVLLTVVFLCGEVKAVSIELCGSGSTKSERILGVNGSDVVLHSAPNAKSEKLINQKATQITNTTQYLKIDASVTVVEECAQGDWSKIRVKSPEWLQSSHKGWVESSFLIGQKKMSGGSSAFTEADFVWDKKITPYKSIIVAGVNKVHRDNPQCKTIDPATAYISSDKGSSSDPVFFVTCGTGAGTFNAYFSRSEVEKGSELGEAKHLERSRAINLCESYAKSKTKLPSTFTFSRVIALTVKEHPNGRTTVTSSFAAKNSLNLELKHNIRCLLDATGLLEANISEAN